MKTLYRDTKPLSSVLQFCLTVLCAAAYVVCCLPSFYWIGKFALQAVSSVLLSVLVTAVVLLFLPRSLRIISDGLSLFLLSMVLYALWQQIRAQTASDGIQLRWIYTFFYDRPFTVALVWGAAFVGVLLLRLFLPYNETYAAFREDFTLFFQSAFRYFMVFYTLVLIYCFVLQRQPGGQSGFNLIPFTMISAYLQSFRYAYEAIFYMIGNVLCFLPIGFYISVMKRRTPVWRIVLTPIVLSLLIEASQLLLGMGHFDVDDIIMNATGFYIGFLIARLFDWIRSRITAGEETSIFRFSERNA